MRAGCRLGALEPAVAAHVIEREDGTIRFTHPLLSSVLYRDLGEERRGVHGRIAEVVRRPARCRARHLALSMDRAGLPPLPTCSTSAASLAADRGAVGGRGRARRAGAPADAAGRVR